jgi:hypothetical protein
MLSTERAEALMAGEGEDSIAAEVEVSTAAEEHSMAVEVSMVEPENLAAAAITASDLMVKEVTAEEEVIADAEDLRPAAI